MLVDGRHVQQGDQDDHDVVDDRRPHVGAEPAAHVEDRAEQRVHPVEEDLRDEEVGEHQHGVVLAGIRDVAAVQVDERPGERSGHHGDDEQRDHAKRVDPPGVPFTPVRVILGRADQHRDHDRGEDAAEHQVVHGVRQGVGVVVGRGERRLAEGDHQHQRAQEPGSPGRERAEGHDPARPGEVGRGGLRRPLRPGRRNLVGVRFEDAGAVVLDVRRGRAVARHEPRHLARRLRVVERLEGRLRVARGHRRQERRRCRGGPRPVRGRHVPLTRRERRTGPRTFAPPVLRPLPVLPVRRTRRKRRPGGRRPGGRRWRRVRVVARRCLLRARGSRGRRRRRYPVGRRPMVGRWLARHPVGP